MKLLFDENLSPRLVTALADEYPGSAHVHDVGLGSADDAAVWAHARAHDLLIVSKDSDFVEMAILQEQSPKFIWLRAGNCATETVRVLLREHRTEIEALVCDPNARYCVIE